MPTYYETMIAAMLASETAETELDSDRPEDWIELLGSAATPVGRIRTMYGYITDSGAYVVAETAGLDYDSAREATPRLYGVSFGNGNDGVSHMFADYYVRTAEPWRLAEIAMVSSFKEEWQAAASEAIEIDGERDYTISAVIYNPLDTEPAEDDGMSYCDANGAWCICEVFPEDDPRDGPMIYDSLADAFTPAELALV